MKRTTKHKYSLIEPHRTTDAVNPHTAPFLNQRYANSKRRLAYPNSTDPTTWQRWRRALRRQLQRILCMEALGPIPCPKPTILATQNMAHYQRQKIAYETLSGNWISAYLLIPYTPGPKPAVICPHGHVKGGKSSVVSNSTYGVAYGHELAVQGCVVLAPDNAGMGERDTHSPIAAKTGGCMLTWVRLNHMGLDLTGLRIFDLKAGLSLLAKRPDVNAQRLGAAGLSGGCWLAQVLTALDRRLKAVILSGFFTTFAQTIWHGHCICHHPHGLGTICDMPDISALIAPRPQFIESGINDTNYPHEPAYTLVKNAYSKLGATKHLQLDRYAGGHLFHGTYSIPWLVQQLSN